MLVCNALSLPCTPTKLCLRPDPLQPHQVRNAAIKVVAELYRLKRMAGDVLDPQKALGQLKPSLLQVGVCACVRHWCCVVLCRVGARDAGVVGCRCGVM